MTQGVHAYRCQPIASPSHPLPPLCSLIRRTPGRLLITRPPTAGPSSASHRAWLGTASIVCCCCCWLHIRSPGVDTEQLAPSLPERRYGWGWGALDNGAAAAAARTVLLRRQQRWLGWMTLLLPPAWHGMARKRGATPLRGWRRVSGAAARAPPPSPAPPAPSTGVRLPQAVVANCIPVIVQVTGVFVWVVAAVPSFWVRAGLPPSQTQLTTAPAARCCRTGCFSHSRSCCPTKPSACASATPTCRKSGRSCTASQSNSERGAVQCSRAGGWLSLASCTGGRRRAQCYRRTRLLLLLLAGTAA